MRLLSTNAAHNIHPLSSFDQTSAATAQAARLAAQIWSDYPDLWPETVRGRRVLADIKAQVGGDLFIAAAAGVELERELADLFGQLKLNEMVDVLGARVRCERGPARAVPAVSQYGVQALADLRDPRPG